MFPPVGTYYCMNIVLVGIATVMSSIVVRVSRYSHAMNPLLKQVMSAVCIGAT